MSTYLRKIIDIGPNALFYEGSKYDYRQLRLQPWWPELKATTSTIRMWADFPTLQPSASFRLFDTQSPGYASVRSLDEQIKAANADGFEVMLMPYRYPRWANETANIVPGSDADLNFTPWDRVDKTTWNAWNTDKANATKRKTLVDKIKKLEYRLPPAGHGTDTAWGLFLSDLWARYVRDQALNGRVTYIEIVNEPNLQLWPQRTASGTTDKWAWNGTGLFVTCDVAEMMQTAKALAGFYGPAATPFLVAPSTADTDVGTNGRSKTLAINTVYSSADSSQGFSQFVPDLIGRLNDQNFVADGKWIWSTHNYNDVELEQLRIAFLPQYLNGKWQGMRSDNTCSVFVTEGGARLAVVGTLATQATRIQHAWTALQQQPGVGMMAQYLVYTDPNYDTGLREAADGAARPAWGVWNSLPRYQ
jgi:hypothetical protein